MYSVRYSIRYHNLYIRRVESVSTRVRCPIRSGVISGVQHTYMYQAMTINYITLWTVYYYYVNGHQLPHVIDASHTTSITRVNRVLSYWKWSVGDIVHTLGGSCTYPRPWPRLLMQNQVLPQGSQEIDWGYTCTQNTEFQNFKIEMCKCSILPR